MNSRIGLWKEELKNNTSLFEEKFKNLSTDDLNWKPNSKSWSIGEVIDHLIITNTAYFKIPNIISDPNFKSSFLTKLPFIANVLGNMILKSVDPNTERKAKTFKSFSPSSSKVDGKILEIFKETQVKLDELIDENQQLILDRTIIPSPINKHIIYKFDTVIDILVNHQKRHFNQACNVLENMKNNG